MHNSPINRSWRMALGGVAVVGLLAGLLMAVPTTRAAIDDLLRRMGIHLAPEAETNNTTVMMAEPANLPVTPVFLSIADVQAQVPFALRTPGWLPEGVAYRTGEAFRKDGEDILVAMLTYRPDGGGDAPDAPALFLEVSAGDLPPWYLSEKAAQDVMVNGQNGVYIHGGWTTDQPLQPGESSQVLFWDSAEDSSYLSWVEEGIAYRLRAYGLGLGLDELTRIAESLK